MGAWQAGVVFLGFLKIHNSGTAGGSRLKFGTGTEAEGGFHPNPVPGVPVPACPGGGASKSGLWALGAYFGRP